MSSESGCQPMRTKEVIALMTASLSVQFKTPTKVGMARTSFLLPRASIDFLRVILSYNSSTESFSTA